MESLKDEYDVVVIGAGISGIGAAYHLQAMCPHTSFVVLESRAELGGTWSFFKYPGLRSDSDMLTFGYSFHPWTRPEVLAPAGLILDYLREVVEKFGLEKYIHYSSPVAKAAWSSEDNRWSVTVAAPSSSSSSFPPRQIRAKYVFMCGGYYEYDKGNMPRFEGQHSFKGKIVHPQAWEEVEGPVDVKGGAAYAGSTGKVDVVGKRVAVIGSGATAVTLVPELVKQGAAHVTCVQRSPSYLYSVSPQDWFVKLLTSVGLPASTAAQFGRKRQAYLQVMSFRFCTAFPTVARFLLLGLVRLSLGNGADMTHFSPKYDPWKQRLCAIVSGDFFTAVGTEGGGASMATGHIDRFTPQGILMKGGQEVKADIIVTATGMNMQRNFPMSWIETTVDGVPYVASEHMTYKGLMLSGVPNFFYCFGYPNIAWTLRSDLVAQFACRAIEHMYAHKLAKIQAVPSGDVVVQGNGGAFGVLSSGYLQRASNGLPRQGSRAPWITNDDYLMDVTDIGEARFDADSAPEILFTK